MSVIVLLLLGAAVYLGYRHGGARVMASAARWGLILGGIGFAAGFFGPMILKPDANQGPLLGIFITGPLGFIGGLFWGTLKAVWEGQRSAGE